jgi:hypothetical protein
MYTGLPEATASASMDSLSPVTTRTSAVATYPRYGFSLPVGCHRSTEFDLPSSTSSAEAWCSPVLRLVTACTVPPADAAKARTSRPKRLAVSSSKLQKEDVPPTNNTMCGRGA